MPEFDPFHLLIGAALIDWALTALWFSPYWSICIPVWNTTIQLPTFSSGTSTGEWPTVLSIKDRKTFLVKGLSNTRALVREPYWGESRATGTLFFVAQIDRSLGHPALVFTIKLRPIAVVLVGWILLGGPISILSLIVVLVIAVFALAHLRGYREALLAFGKCPNNETSPNLGVAADRDPRERDSRPLNTDR